ncbi:MAG: hypothetical protein NVS1B4_17070 [Gemmatimonadaceae bacterium]
MQERVDEVKTNAPTSVPGSTSETAVAGDLPTTGNTLHAGAGAAAHQGSEEAVGDARAITEQVRLALRRVKDPDLNLNIIDLGLVYDVRASGSVVDIDMSLTSPGCPSGAELTSGAEQAARGVDGVSDVTVRIVWDPMWTPDRIEPRVRAYLGF